ncbi:hypothetical protein [Baaleninema sp.]|uniref:hypothetical protein n=1 Tax=Baaleninema sp. TaxID=3101197 RepID=UPI003CFC4499
MLITLTCIGLVLPKKEALWRTLAIYLPTILVSLLCMVFKGDRETALAICESWQAYGDAYQMLATDCDRELPGVLTFFDISMQDVFQKIWSNNIFGDGKLKLSLWLFVFGISTVVLVRASSKILINSVEKLNQYRYTSDRVKYLPPVSSSDILKSFSFKYAVIPFLGSFILYIIALDWGRWFFITSISYMLCCLSPSLIQAEVAGYSQNQWILRAFNPIYQF